MDTLKRWRWLLSFQRLWCWEQNPETMAYCTRKHKGHAGPHRW